MLKPTVFDSFFSEVSVLADEGSFDSFSGHGESCTASTFCDF